MKKPALIAITIITAMLLLAVAVFQFRKPEPTGSSQLLSTSNNNQDLKNAQESTYSGRTIGDLWSLDETDQASKERFDVARIHGTLAKIHLDQNNNLIYDNRVLESLREAFVYTNIDWTEARLEEFIGIVKAGLPGETGEQAAALIRNFYDYQQAEEQTTELYDANITDPEPLNNIEQKRRYYEELTALRELYLSKPVADALFAEEDATTEYFFTTLELVKDPTLSPEEKIQQQTLASEALKNRKPRINNWDARYLNFTQQKQSIMEAAIPPAEKKRQVNDLVEQHFDEHEQAQAEHLNLKAIDP